jgi:signal transduction histidine kinase/CHASE3 domain sensor protein
MLSNIKISKNFASKYLILVICIVIVFGIAVGIFVNFSRIQFLRNIKTIAPVQKDYARLDNCIFKLYNAENSCRMYILSGDRSFYNQFNKEIGEIRVIIDTLESQDRREQPISSENFDVLITQKKIRTAQFIQLRKLADSLIDFSSDLGDKMEQIIPKRNNFFSSRQFKNIVRIDTLVQGIQGKAKKRFFGRIIDAINNKGSKGVDGSKSTLVKTTISGDTTSTGIAYNKLQLAEINKYYAKLYRTNLNLKAKEKELLLLNHQIINSIVESLKKYNVLEKNYESSLQSLIYSSSIKGIESLDTLTRALVFFAIALLIFIFFAIYKLYKNEIELVKYSKKSEQLVLSKSMFLAKMSHEIRTPLNSIIGFSEQLSRSGMQPEQKEQITAIESSSSMLLDVVNDVLDFSKFESGNTVLEHIPFSPYAAISEVIQSMQTQAQNKDIDLITTIKIDKDRYINGDPLKLKQLVMNLLSNAIKFTDKGTVTLEVALLVLQKGKCQLKATIADTGVGIRAADLPIIFEEFTQIYTSSSEKNQKGTGLGLAICKKIVESHGGKINVTSIVGQGTIFSFELPFTAADKPAEDAIMNRPEDIEQIFKGKHILLVDDNRLNVIVAGSLLKKHKMTFDTAQNGREAFDLYLDNKYDVILTDIQMPIMDGIELAEKIRGLEEKNNKKTPILGVTANVLHEDRKRYLDSGMNELLLKPFKEQDFIEKMVYVLKDGSI